MDIEFVLLGLLSWKSFSGYDLKKIISGSDIFYWSGNNNQIYNSLIQLHKHGLVTQQVEYQENLPARKIYTLTEQGRAALREDALSPPELPELHHTFLIQLAWADQLSNDELDALLAKYAEEIDAQLRMQQFRAGDQAKAPNRTSREQYLWKAISDNWLAFYRHELDWVRGLRQGLRDIDQPEPQP